MRPPYSMARTSLVASMALACAAASAAPVVVHYTGTVSSYDHIDLSAGLPLGAAVTLSLTFNETFADGSYDFADPLGPVSGAMHIGSASFVLDDVEPWTYLPNPSTGGVAWVRPLFKGGGPRIDGADFYGLLAAISPDLQLVGELVVAYGITTTSPHGGSSTAFGYARLATRSVDIRHVGEVPAPPSLPLAMTALLAAGWVRRRVETRAPHLQCTG